jgi:voltage-gated sodium channel
MMIGIVLETLQREHEQNDKEAGQGIAGEVDHIDRRTQQMDQRLVRIETLLEELHRRDGSGSDAR